MGEELEGENFVWRVFQGWIDVKVKAKSFPDEPGGVGGSGSFG
jgi:hypothetical protein